MLFILAALEKKRKSPQLVPSNGTGYMPSSPVRHPAAYQPVNQPAYQPPYHQPGKQPVYQPVYQSVDQTVYQPHPYQPQPTKARLCLTPSCDRFGDDSFDGYCSQCYDRHRQVVYRN